MFWREGLTSALLAIYLRAKISCLGGAACSTNAQQHLGDRKHIHSAQETWVLTGLHHDLIVVILHPSCPGWLLACRVAQKVRALTENIKA